jgi:hypothetical protein
MIFARMMMSGEILPMMLSPIEPQICKKPNMIVSVLVFLAFCLFQRVSDREEFVSFFAHT